MILAGRLDKLFPSDNIRFDTEHGSYYPLVHSHTPIALSAADPTLLHWGINLLNRNGFSCLIDENVSVSTENRHTHKNGEIDGLPPRRNRSTWQHARVSLPITVREPYGHSRPRNDAREALSPLGRRQ